MERNGKKSKAELEEDKQVPKLGTIADLAAKFYHTIVHIKDRLRNLFFAVAEKYIYVFFVSQKQAFS